MMKRYLKYICMLLVVLSGITSCSDVEFFDSEDEVVSMTYTIGLDDDVSSRAIGDGSQVDKLYVGIYEGNMEVERLEANINDGKADITVELFKGRTYDLAFWAQSSQTSVYDRTDLKNVDITYPESMTLQEADRMDAFFLLKEDVTVNQMGEDGGALTLTRPFAQLNIASSEADAPEKVKKAILTVNYENSDPLILTFTDFTVGEGDKISYDGLDYYYLVTALLKPGIITTNITLLDGNNNEIESFDLNEGNGMELVANYRYNVLGDMITPEELPGWDGVFPTESPLTQDEQNRYIIDEEMDLAWLSQNASSLIENSTFIVTKEVLDMGNHSISSIQLPIGSTFDGGGKTIKNFANSLFGDVTNLTVQNLVLDNVNATSNGHVGVLVNTLIGSSTFTGVNITNSSATTTNGAAGGMVGYIVRQSETKRSETLSVTFTNCDLVGVTATGTESEGKFVGLFSGYDNGEQLSFDADCSVDVTTSVADYSSSYIGTNQSCWAGEITNTYDGWLGTETYRRGIVKFGDVRLVPKWDGTTTVAPLTANEDYDGVESGMVIYSPTDIVYLSGKNVNTENVYMREDVDLGSMNFTPIMTCHYFDGLKKASLDYESLTTDDCHTIYNMTITRQVDGNGAAFIKTLYDDDIHRNINFVDAHIELDYDESSGNAYGATLCSHPQYAGTYTVSNVHCYDGYIKAVCKTGGLLGRVAYNTLNCTNCSVSNYRIENYEVNVPENFAKILTDKGLYCSDCIFYPQGEIGGFIGFLQSSATISNCSVTQTVLNCYGQNAKTAKIGFSKFLAISYDVPGRYVNQFIGNVRTSSGETIDISSIKVEGNSYERDSWNHSYLGSTTTYIGGAYAIPVMDNKGSIKIDGKSLNFPL